VAKKETGDCCVTASKVRHTFSLRCRCCNNTVRIKEGETVHPRCSVCGKSIYRYFDEQNNPVNDNHFFEVVESGEFIAGGQPLTVV